MATPVRTALTTSSSKTSQSTVNTASVTVNANEMLIVIAAYDDQTLNSIVWNGINLDIDTIGNVVGAGVRTRIGFLNVTSTASSVVTFTWAANITSKAWAVLKVTNVNQVDQVSSNSGTSGTQTSGNITTTHPVAMLVAGIGTEGPSGDTRGTWGSSFTAGQRSGTTGNPAAGNITIDEGFRAVSSTLTVAGGKTGATSRDYAAIVVSLVLRPQKFGQAQAIIGSTVTYSQVAQAQARIKNTYRWHGQAQAYILRLSSGQAQATIARTSTAVASVRGIIDTGIYSALDTFTRNESNQLGTADAGGDWSLITGTASSWDVDGSKIIHTASDTTITGQGLKNVTVKNAIQIQADITFQSFGAQTGSINIVGLYIFGTPVGASAAEAGLHITVNLSTGVASLAARQPGNNAGVPASLGTISEGETWTLKGEIYILRPSHYGFRGKAWKTGDAEPGWLVVVASGSPFEPGYNPANPGIYILSGNSSTIHYIDNFSVIPVSRTEYGQAEAFITGLGLQYGQAQASILATTGITYVQEVTVFSDSSATTHDVTITNAPTLGNHLILRVITAAAITFGITDSAGNTWTQRAWDASGSAVTSAIWETYVANALTTSDIITITTSASRGVGVLITEFSGGDPAGWFVASTSTDSNNDGVTAFDSGSVAIGDGTLAIATLAMTATSSGIAETTGTYDNSGSTFNPADINRTGYPFRKGDVGGNSLSSPNEQFAGTYTTSRQSVALLAIFKPAPPTEDFVATHGLALALIRGQHSLVVLDTFTRSESGTIGTPDIGPDWTDFTDESEWDVADGVLRLTVSDSSPNNASVGDGVISVVDSRARYKVRFPTLPEGGYHTSRIYTRRQLDTNETTFRSGVRVSSTGVLTVVTEQEASGVRTMLTPGGETEWAPTGVTVTANQWFWFEAETTGQYPDTHINLRVWLDGDTRPTSSVLDDVGTSADLNVGGSIGIHAEASTSGSVSFPVSFEWDDLTLENLGSSFISGNSQAKIKQVYFAVSQAQAQVKTAYTQTGQAQARIKQTYPLCGVSGTPTLVQEKQGFLTVGTTITLDSTPTEGNLLVAFQWSRSVAAAIPTGFTLGDELTSGVLATVSYRRVQAGDTAVIESLSSATRSLYVQEWSGLQNPTAWTTGAFSDTNPLVINPSGTGYTIGVGVVYTDIAGREVHIVSPSTLEYEGWVDVSDFGPFGSVGYDSGTTLTAQATSGAISFHIHGYIVGNFPPSSDCIGAFGQAQALISQFSTGSGQAQANIIAVNRGVGQTQARIKNIYRGYGQAQSRIKQQYTVIGQAQGRIKQTYRGYGQAQARIKQGYYGLGQALSTITKLVWKDTFTRTLTGSFGAPDFGNVYSSDDTNGNVSSGAGNSSISTVTEQGNLYTLTNSIVQFDFLTVSDIISINIVLKDYVIAVGNPEGWAAWILGVTAYETTQFIPTGVEWWTVKVFIYNNTLRVKAWRTGDIEPSWPTETTGASNGTNLSAYIQLNSSSDKAEIDNFYMWSPDVPLIGKYFGQASAQISATASALGQAQSDIKQFYVQQGQAQSFIKNFYVQTGQAQAQIKTYYTQVSQSQGNIKNTYNGMGQSQAQITQSYTTVGQANAYILGIEKRTGQALAQIKQFYTQIGQSNSWIENTYNGIGQANALIAQSYTVVAQAQSSIKAISNGLGQTQADIKAVGNASGQSQADIQQSYVVVGQAQAHITDTYNGSGQAQADIKQGYYGLGQAMATIRGNAHGQAQGSIKTSYRQHAQSRAQIKRTYRGHGQARARIKRTYAVVAQAQSQIKNVYTQTGQSQSDIKQFYVVTGQAQAWIKSVGIICTGQAQGTILQIYVVSGQANARLIAFGVTQSGQAQGNVRFNGNTAQGQAQAKINAFGYSQYGQAQAQIKTVYAQVGQAQSTLLAVGNVSGQAEALILQVYYDLAQAQSDIKAVGYGVGQANAYIILSGLNQFGQAQALIRQVYVQVAQSQALIYRTENGLGQAQGQVKSSYTQSGQAQANLKQAYKVSGQSEALIRDTYYISGQAQAKINAFDVISSGQAQANITFTGNAVHGQAQGTIHAFGVNAYGQAQGTIKGVGNSYGQSQADIKQTYVIVGQAAALIAQTEIVTGQAQGQIKNSYTGIAQAQAQIKTAYVSSGQSQSDILNTYSGSGQANVYIILLRQGSGQAQAAVKASTWAHAQATVVILGAYTASGHAQSTIKATFNSSGQAQARIVTRYVQSGQALASITSGLSGTGQAQALIVRHEAYAQAQGFIATVHTLANVVVDDDRVNLVTLSDDLVDLVVLDDDVEEATNISDTGINVSLEDEHVFTLIIDDKAFI